MISQFCVIRKAPTEDLLRVWTPPDRLGLARQHADRLGLARRHANSVAQIASWGTVAVGVVALGGLVGCGEVYLGDRKWACNKQAIEYDATDSLRAAEGDRFWRFNDETMGREVNGLGDLTIAPLVADALSPAKPIRMGGEGFALITDANSSSNQTAAAPYANGIPLGSSLTYALWFSLPKSWLGVAGSEKQRMVLLSTKTEQTTSLDCGGHELALQGQKGSGDELAKVSLVFSYFDAKCEPRELEAELGRIPAAATTGLYSLDAWGLGRWYHVAASVSPVPGSTSRGQINLYWEGVEVSDAMASQVNMRAPRIGTTANIHVGSNPTNATRFKGRIDDVALIQRALSREELLAFRLNSLSKYGLDEQRWATWEVERSTASWNGPQTKGLAVVCADGLSSGCGAATILDWGQKKFTDLDHIVLSADLPAGKVTDLMLAADQGGRQFCKWTINGIGGADYYLSVKEQAQGLEQSDQPNPSNVNELKWCRCDDCDCSFTVQSAMIGSEWTKEVGEYPCLMCDLQPYLSTPPEPETFKWSRGAKGPNGYCWRPIAYDVNSHARFIETPTEGGSVGAILSGRANTTALLAADFGVAGRPFSEGEEVVICANLPNNQPFQIILKSANEGYCQIAVQGTDTNAQSSTAYPRDGRLDVAYCETHKDENNQLYGEDGTLLKFEPERIRYLGIQKLWAMEVQTTIRIDSVRFNGDRNCPTFPVLAGHVQ